MRYLAWLVCLLTFNFVGAQDRVVINENIDASLQRGQIPVAVVSDDPVLGERVSFALSTHGAITISPSSSVRVRLGRSALTAVVACDNARCAFQTNVEAANEHDLFLKVADAVLVGLGQRWQLKPLFAGTKVAFTSRYTGHQEIYITNLARSRTMRVTNLENTSIGPRWSADGTRVYFITSARTGFPEIFSSNGIGNPQKVITDVRGALGSASASPDGQYLAFASSNKGSMDIYVSGTQGQAPHRVIATPDVDADPSWSPDSQRWAFTSGPIGRPGIYISSASGSGMTRLATEYNYCTEPHWNPVFPDQIAFTFQSGRLSLGVYDLKTRAVTVVPVVAPLNLSHASWCADGRHLVATQASSNNSWLVVVDSVTGKVTRLTDSNLGECSEPDCWMRRN